MSKFVTLTFTDGWWGYLNALRDWSGGENANRGWTPDGHHQLTQDIDPAYILPGVTDRSLARRGTSSGYGPVKPPDDSEKELWEDWDECRMQRLDYYVSLLNGSPDPDSGEPYLYNQVFVRGEDEEGDYLPRQDVLEILRELDLRGAPDFWFPNQVFFGLDFGGIPKFSQELRAHTDIGVRWYDVCSKLGVKLPVGYEWYNHGKFGELHIDTEVTP